MASYPHWPPSTYEEAVAHFGLDAELGLDESETSWDQLDVDLGVDFSLPEPEMLFIGESFPHRLYLAHCWVTSLYIKLAAGDSTISVTG
ncbi:hypothetical protein V8E54_004152 [Elaphomyces granulatus]